jgi:tetraacyldisaccharide 4'-kinase
LFGHFLNCLFKTPKKVSKPVICIGNLVAGGAGKTPVAIAIGLLLRDLNIDFAYLSGGYGSEIKNFTNVNKELHNAREVGDEPLLLAETASTFICKNRVFGAKMISKMPEKKLIIIDDGLQNPSLVKDFTIAVIDGNYGFGNGFIMPAGALREPIAVGIKKSDLIVIVGEDKLKIAENFCQSKPVAFAKIVPLNQEKFHNNSYVAFCGIGRPEKFFASLEQNNINVISKLSYPDHYLYQENDVTKMMNLAKENNAKLITTKKDWVRFDEQYQSQIEYFDIKIEFEETAFVKQQLLKLING